MILLFLGSWRSTLIVCISIPLSILTSLAILYAMGETINIMTLGGMALAVGILVDDATVEIENIHRNLGLGKGIVRAILDGAQQIAVPAFVSTLCICIVFVPVAFLTGTAKYLFTPLAMAVALAMGASYLLSRTLIPTMIRFLLPAELHLYKDPDGEAEAEVQAKTQIGCGACIAAFHSGFEKFRNAYSGFLASALDHRGAGDRLLRHPRGGLRRAVSFHRDGLLPARWTPARFACTSAPLPAPASRRRNRSSRKWRRPSARSFPATS